MLQLGPIAFAQPYLLLALLGLPLLWWLLRVTPPSPRTVRFPALRFILGLVTPEETPARTPLWLILLRMAVAALLIVGLAQPLINPTAKLTGSGPLILVIDDDWAAAGQWQARLDVAEELLAEAERENRSVVVVTTAPSEVGESLAVTDLLTANAARRLVQGLSPKPWQADRAAALAALESLSVEGSGHAVWLSNGLDDETLGEMALRLQSLGRLDLVRDDAGQLPRMLLLPEIAAGGLDIRLRRIAAGTTEKLFVRAIGDDGRLVSRSEIAFEAEATETSGLLALPSELRNRIARLSIEGQDQAGGVLLLDERWRRRPVGLVAGGAGEEAQPLLSEIYYLQRALEPYTVLHQAPIEALVERDLAVMVLSDVGGLDEASEQTLATWVESGGLLMRFAGPRVAETETMDSLLPVRLRGGGRILGGVLTWATPSRLAPFDADSPFAGLPVPDDVAVSRQVLAEPSLDLGDKTWARLVDGTPLVTADRRGDGWVVLVHTTANTEWSTLALSGLFVDMLRRLIALSQGVPSSGEEAADLPPIETLDGFGRLAAPAPTVLAVAAEDLAESRVTPRHPPGYYGSDGERRALNLSPGLPPLRPIEAVPSGVRLIDYATSGERSIKAWLLTAALLLALADLMIALALRGLLKGRSDKALAGLSALLVLVLSGPADAQSLDRSEGFALQATLETRLAYVETGIPALDDASRDGLMGLTRVLQRRTSVEPGPPIGVTLGEDEINFFPLLYWPVAPEQRSLTSVARDAVNHYLEHGGTILFDLRDPSSGARLFGRAGRSETALQRLTEGIEVPPLVPVPPDHVLTKAFYLMQDFPGRFAGGTLWVGDSEGRVNDGVSSVLIGANDWASAWAVDDFGRPRFAVVPGGERQREMAYRVGVNLVMYALTGNYKADQVHVPFILERLGQ